MNKALFLSSLAILGFFAMGAAAQGEPAEVPVLITFKAPPTAADAAQVAHMGGTVRYRYHLVPVLAARLPEGALAGLSRNPRIAAVELDGKVFATTSELDSSWGVQRIGSGIAHANGNVGAGVKVAILDTGVDYTHPDLDGPYAGGYDFVNNDSDPADDNGHGTHVSGIVAAESNGSGVVGVSPGASLYALKVLDAQGSGNWSDIIAALQWAVTNGMQVANLSLGSSRDPGTAVETAFANAEAAGLVIVAAAGNSGSVSGKGNKVEWPGRYTSVIAVAATDANDVRAYFSSTGDAVELAAPGVAVTSAAMGGGTVTMSGTSMAAPHVAGVAALALAAGVTDGNSNNRVNDEVRQRLASTADDLGVAGRDTVYGFGLVDADEAGALAGPVNAAPVVTVTAPANGASFTSGALVAFAGSALDAEDGDLTAVLAWSSNRDGALGTGGSFSAALSDGIHVVTASVTDSGSRTGSATVTITVGTPPALTASVSTDKAAYADRETVTFTVTVTDGANPAAGATVQLSLITASNKTYGGTALTDAQGVAYFTYKILAKRDGTGTYAAAVTAAKDGFAGGSGSTTFQVGP